MEENQNIVYISRDTTQCPICFGEIEGRDKKRGTFFCLYCGQRLAIGANTNPVKNTDYPAGQNTAQSQAAQPAQPVAQPVSNVQQNPYARPAAAVVPPVAGTPQGSYARPDYQQSGGQLNGINGQDFAGQGPFESAFAETTDDYRANLQGEGQSAFTNAANPVNGGNQKKAVGAKKNFNLFGVLSLVFGIISLFFCCCYGTGIVFGVLAIVFGAVGIKRSKNQNRQPDAMNVIGLILGIVGIVIGAIVMARFGASGLMGKNSPMNSFINGNTSEIVSEEKTSQKDYYSSRYGAGKDSEEKEKASETKSEKKSEELKSEEVKSEEKTEVKSETESEIKSEETSEKESEKTEEKPDPDVIRPEVKDAIDSYEKFMDEYIDFMKKYQTSNSTELLMDYLDWISKYSEMVEKMEKLEGDLTDAEAKYYSEVSLRISGKMLQYSLTQ